MTMRDIRSRQPIQYAANLLAALVMWPSLAAAQDADLIVHSGKIVTVDSRFSIAEALAIRGDRIAAVGTNAEVRRLAGSTTCEIDLRGATVLPGLIDSHVHPVAAAMHEFDHPLPEMDTIADVLAYVAARARVLPEGEWIALRQVFITRLRDQRYPTRRELDQAAPRHPVLFATGPDASVNSLALTLSGIDRETRITDGGTGSIERDPQTGEPTGILRSCTRIVKMKSSAMAPTRAEELVRLKSLLADYNSVGLTSVTDKDASDSEIELFRQLKEAGELTCRVYLHASVDAQLPLEKIAERIAGLDASPLHAYDNRLWLGGIKTYLDGGMLTGSAYLRAPWGVSRIYSITDPEYRGLLYIPAEKLRDITRLAVQHDLQMTAHSVGDGAVHALLDAYSVINTELLAETGRAKRRSQPPPAAGTAATTAAPLRSGIALQRPCVTHCNFMSREAIETMRSLGIVCDLQPAWLWLDGQTLLTQFGENRMEFFQPYRSLFDAGVIAGGGSDHMQKIGSLRSVNPYNPFLGMWIAVCRQPRRGDGPLHPRQRLTREQALRLYTINNAYLTFEEQEKGSLEPGKLADFIVLDTDLLTCPEERIRDIQVLQTYLGGTRVFERP